MRRDIGSLLGGLVGFGVAYLGVGALLPAPQGTTAPLRAESTAPTRAVDHETASLVAPGASAEPHVAVMGTPTVVEEAATAPATIDGSTRGAGPREFLLHGVVTAHGGAALQGASVGVQLPTGGRVATTTDDLGRYTLGPLEPGAWSVTAGMRNHHSVSADVGPPQDDTLARQDFELTAQQVVRVRLVTSEGDPALPTLYAAKLDAYRLQLVPVATRDDPGATFTEVTGSLNNPFGIGWFRESGLMGEPAVTPDEYGTVTLREDGPAWLSLVAAHQVLAKQPLAPDTDEVVFVVDSSDVAALYSTVRGRALDAASGGAVAARAFLNDDPFVHGQAGAAADPSSGDFTVERALPGQRWLIVKCDGYAEVKRKITVPRGSTFEAGEISMHRPVALSGKVHDTEGKPFEAIIEWGVLDVVSGTVAWAQQVRAQSQADGTFTVSGLEPAVYVVRSPGLDVRGPRPSDPRVVSRPVRVDARTGSVDGIVVVLEPTIVVTLVAPKRVQPAGGSWVHAAVLDSVGLPIARGWPGRYAEETPMHVPEGDWTLVLTRDGVELERRALVVADSPLRIELDL